MEGDQSVSSHGSDRILRVEGRGNGTLAVADITAPPDIPAPPESRLGRGASPVIDDLEPALAPKKKRLSRVNASFLASLEARVIAAILPTIPDSVSPNELTVVGLLGACITSIGLIACIWSTKAVILVPVGLLVHWFGDSLDGSLARYRRIERPSFGFFIDHSSDLFAMSMIIVSFGFSPFLTMTSALLVLTTYLLFSAYTYVKVAVEGVHQLAYGGLGSTEFRLLMATWAIVGAMVGPSILGPKVQGVPLIDIVVGSLALFAFFCLGWLTWRDAARIARMERRQQLRSN
jgi:archaetidylinositol phosphate synthase